MAEPELQFRHYLTGSQEVILSDKQVLEVWYRRGKRLKVRHRPPLLKQRWMCDASTGVLVDSPIDKAERALQRYLTPEQWQQYRRSGSFTAIGQKSRKPYSVQVGRVFDADTHYCIWTARYHVPTADTLLSLALMIQLDERQFLRTAVATPMGLRRNRYYW